MKTQHFLSKTHKWTVSNISHHYLFFDLLWCLVDERRSSLLSNLHGLGEFSVAGDVWHELAVALNDSAPHVQLLVKKEFRHVSKAVNLEENQEKQDRWLNLKVLGLRVGKTLLFVPTKEGWKFSHAPYYASLLGDCSLNPKLWSF